MNSLRHRTLAALCAAAALSYSGCQKQEAAPTAPPVKTEAKAPEAAKPAADPVTADDTNTSLTGDGTDGNWAGYGRGYDSDHYSPIDDINQSNVQKLGLAWSFDLPVGNSHSAPLEVDGTLYFSQAYAVIRAMDVATGNLKWEYDPKVTDVAGDKLRTAWGTRGISFWNNRIYTGTQDGRLIAINAKDGTLAWEVDTTMGKDDGRYITGAPLLYNGIALIGHGGADFSAVRGYVTAYDAETGKKLWRFFTVPGDPKAGPDNEPSDEILATADVKNSWKGEFWKYGGGATVWNSMTYDKELDRVYLGTGNGAPWNQKIRSPGGGDNLFVCSIVALDAKTGKYLWHYQVNPGETWDFNADMDIELATIKLDGKDTKVLMQAPKNGFFYVINRETGKLISAKQWAKQTWAKEIGPDGRPVELPGVRFEKKGQMFVMYPGGMGTHNWMAMAYSPKTGLVYIPRQEAPYAYSEEGIKPATWKADKRLSIASGYAPGDTRVMPPASTGPTGALVAWDPVKQEEKWAVPMLSPVNGGVAATAGNLVFQGNAEGKFVAYAADTGKVLWSFDAHTGMVGQPIVFKTGGKQYVAISVGFGALAAVLGPDAAKFNWQYRQQKRRMLVFSLDGTAKLPENEKIDPIVLIDDPKLKFDDKVVAEGSKIFGGHCLACHGPGAIAGGAAPDLRASQIVQNKETFKAIVGMGGLEKAGMPKFDELSDKQLEAIRTFVQYRARVSAKEQGKQQTN